MIRRMITGRRGTHELKFGYGPAILGLLIKLVFFP